MFSRVGVSIRIEFYSSGNTGYFSKLRNPIYPPSIATS
jgi:hypothetical protein